MRAAAFKSMGLSDPVVKGVQRKGYNLPTPIQRKAIPVILEGRDAVCMARTGSGKTAAFLLPLLEKLKERSAQDGMRGLIMSPTRELAMQTYEFTKALGKFTTLRACCLLGGDSMEDQFEAIHENPDIVIATPGRFLHLVLEMDLSLKKVQYVVFDEADRLFELGFQEQLLEILKRLPESRQTLLFSATLPKLLVDFAQAGLNEPALIRLDTEATLSKDLRTVFLLCRTDDKVATLLYLLRNVIPREELTVVFAATRHHVDYYCMLLKAAYIDCAGLYSSMDQELRRVNVEKFQKKLVSVLVVTDIAARGVDIPLLDNVINVNFPAKAKLFVHRVGRVARAGRTGTAYSLVGTTERPYLIDLFNFLGKPLTIGSSSENIEQSSGVCGTVPQSIIDDQLESLAFMHKTDPDLARMKISCQNATQKFLRNCPPASTEAMRCLKATFAEAPPVHPIFKGLVDEEDAGVSQFLSKVKNFKPNATIFEIGNTSKTLEACVLARKMREKHEILLARKSGVVMTSLESNDAIGQNAEPTEDSRDTPNASSDILSTLVSKPVSKRANKKVMKKPKPEKKSFRDEQFYISYQPADSHTEDGFKLDKSFRAQASNVVLDLMADDKDGERRHKNQMRWDKKRKRFVQEQDLSNAKQRNKKMMRTESGVRLPASFKSDLYEQWKKKSKTDADNNDENDDDDENGDSADVKKNGGKTIDIFEKLGMRNKRKLGRFKPKPEPAVTANGRPIKRELKTKQEILKERKRKETIQYFKTRKQRPRGGNAPYVVVANNKRKK